VRKRFFANTGNLFLQPQIDRLDHAAAGGKFLIGHLHDDFIPARLQGEKALIGPVYRFIVLLLPRNPALAHGPAVDHNAVGQLDRRGFQPVKGIGIIDFDPQTVGRHAQYRHVIRP